MGLDLSGVRRVVEGVLDDRVELWRDLQGEADDELNESTGELVPQAGTPRRYWDGLAAVTLTGQLPSNTQSLDGMWSAAPSKTAYLALLPLTAPQTRPDDFLVVASSNRDPQLTGRRFRVLEAATASYAVVRQVRLQILE
ncbi:hypothetical protein H9Y04_35310 [Streptomyces sp. TRM66268-LWL]|uniref:Uncharacterized protein n=1 Tax=Streptomyces polyasparticus TaxID=2767826 RepID=A0ABR7SQZ4_9ACTN|nr:DUF6093 family protein [Streptomyces polyasparticus]MBC9717813.1 hypothetical protein [Streptomyces polyasparticus]